MIAILLPALFALGTPGGPAFHPSRPQEATPAFMSRWYEPLEARRAVLVNPFCSPTLTAGPVVKDLRFLEEGTALVSNILTVDVGIEDEATRVRKVFVPTCDDDARDCEYFNVLARQVLRWDFDPAIAGGKPTPTRVTIDLRATIEFESLEVPKVRIGPVEPGAIPPPVITPLPDLDTLARRLQAGGGTLDLPPGVVPADRIEKIPRPSFKKISLPTRAIQVAGDLLVHFSPVGTVDKILPLSVRPAAIWPFFQKSVLAWKAVQPARAGNEPAACWMRATFEGKTEISGEVTTVTSSPRTLPVNPADAGVGRP